MQGASTDPAVLLHLLAVQLSLTPTGRSTKQSGRQPPVHIKLNAAHHVSWLKLTPATASDLPNTEHRRTQMQCWGGEIASHT